METKTGIGNTSLTLWRDGPDMVVRRRVRSVLMPLGLYAVSALVVGYFVHQAESGNRGLEAKRALKIQAFGLKQELTAAKADRAIWEHRVALLRSEQIEQFGWIIVGVALMLLIIFRPQGILGDKKELAINAH